MKALSSVIPKVYTIIVSNNTFTWVATVSKGAELTFPGVENSFVMVVCALHHCEGVGISINHFENIKNYGN